MTAVVTAKNHEVRKHFKTEENPIYRASPVKTLGALIVVIEM